jgi:hypothetical protein
VLPAAAYGYTLIATVDIARVSLVYAYANTDSRFVCTDSYAADNYAAPTSADITYKQSVQFFRFYELACNLLRGSALRSFMFARHFVCCAADNYAVVPSVVVTFLRQCRNRNEESYHETYHGLRHAGQSRCVSADRPFAHSGVVASPLAWVCERHLNTKKVAAPVNACVGIALRN